MSGFQGVIKPVRRTFVYRLGIMLVAAIVVVLPVLYIGLIALLGWGVYWHALHNTHIAAMGHGLRTRLMSSLLYLAPILAGGVAILFMLKPLFARPARRHRQISINRGAQPLLFEFVERVCDSVHAPRPARIDLDLAVNASAGFGGGPFRLRKSNLVLTIGMPLVAGLSLQQFGGVLAHEFGHFSQGAGLRMSWIVRSVNDWFARIVYTRDALDAWLDAASEEVDIRIGWVFHLTRFVVYLTRRVLWAFMMLSHALSCGLSRQMEYDADRHEIRLVGCDTFERTSRRLHELDYSAEKLVKTLLTNPQALSHLSGNFARDVAASAGALDTVDEKRLKRRRKQEKTGWFDTHPSFSNRVESAKRDGSEGIFRSDLPAEILFHEFDGLCLALQKL